MGCFDPHSKLMSRPVIGLPHVQLLTERSADAAVLTDPAGVIEYVNPAFEAITGYTRDEVIGRTPAILKSGWHSPDVYIRLWNTLLAGEEFREVMVNRRKSGEIFHEEKTIQSLRDAHGRIAHLYSTGRDVSGRVAAAARLEHAATHDSLTDLPNRVLFLDRLDQAMRHARAPRRPRQFGATHPRRGPWSLRAVEARIRLHRDAPRWRIDFRRVCREFWILRTAFHGQRSNCGRLVDQHTERYGPCQTHDHSEYKLIPTQLPWKYSTLIRSVRSSEHSEQRGAIFCVRNRVRPA